MDLLLFLDYAGTLAFALSGAALAIEKRFDIVGALALALSAGLAGGIIRDVLTDRLPPAAFQTGTYLFLCIAATIIAAFPSLIQKFEKPREFFDAAGLGLFCVVGAATAIDAGLSIIPATFIGAISACGGGVLRDVLTQRTPEVFTPSGLYLIPAAGGSLFVAIASGWDIGQETSAAIVVPAVFAIRLASIRFGWRTKAFGTRSNSDDGSKP